jgi:hypothetical protein
MAARKDCDRILDSCSRRAAKLAPYDEKAARRQIDRCLRVYGTCREQQLTSGLGWPQAKHARSVMRLIEDGEHYLREAQHRLDQGACKGAFRAFQTANNFGQQAYAHVVGMRGADRPMVKAFNKTVDRLERSFVRRCVIKHGWMGGRTSR